MAALRHLGNSGGFWSDRTVSLQSSLSFGATYFLTAANRLPTVSQSMMLKNALT